MTIFDEIYYDHNFLLSEVDNNNNGLDDKLDVKVNKLLKKVRDMLEKTWDELYQYADKNKRPKLTNIINYIGNSAKQISSYKDGLNTIVESNHVLELSKVLGDIYKNVYYIVEGLKNQDNLNFLSKVNQLETLLKELNEDYKVDIDDMSNPAKASKIKDIADRDDKDIELIDENTNTFTLNELNQYVNYKSNKKILLEAKLIMDYNILIVENNQLKKLNEGLLSGLKSVYNKIKGDTSEKGEKITSFLKQKAKEIKKFSDKNIVEPLGKLDDYVSDLKTVYDSGNIEEMERKISELFKTANALRARIRKAKKYEKEVLAKVQNI